MPPTKVQYYSRCLSVVCNSGIFVHNLNEKKIRRKAFFTNRAYTQQLAAYIPLEATKRAEFQWRTTYRLFSLPSNLFSVALETQGRPRATSLLTVDSSCSLSTVANACVSRLSPYSACFHPLPPLKYGWFEVVQSTEVATAAKQFLLLFIYNFFDR